MKGIVSIKLKKDILDPEGKAIKNSLEDLGFNQIKDIRVGKLIEIEFKSKSKNVKSILKDISKAVLVNQVTEDFYIEILEE